MTFFTRKAALEAQNKLHNIKTMTGVSELTLTAGVVLMCSSTQVRLGQNRCCSSAFYDVWLLGYLHTDKRRFRDKRMFTDMYIVGYVR